MIITVVSDFLGTENNGTTITAMRLIEGLRKKGHTVRILAPGLSEDKDNYPLEVIKIPIVGEYIKKNDVEFAKIDDTIIENAIRGADLVHVILPFAIGTRAAKFANKIGVPVTAAFHCQPENITSHFFMKDVKPVNDLTYWAFLKSFYKHVKYIHCPTEFIAEMLREHGYMQKLEVVSNGVADCYRKKEIEKRDAWKGKFVILMTGRYSKEKRQDLLLKAAKLSKHSDEIQLVFAGQGVREKKLKRLGEGLKNPPVFEFFPHGTLADVINEADLYVHCSDVEIEAIACLEAIACGLFSIISNSKRSATKAFALTPHNLFQRGNAKDLQEKIDFIIEHPEVKEEIMQEYAAYAEKFRLENSIDKMERFFLRVVAEEKLSK